MSQVLSEPTRKDALVHLLFVNREGFMWDVMVSGCLGHTGHKMVIFNIFSAVRKRDRRVATLDFRRESLKLFTSYLADRNLLLRAWKSSSIDQSLRKTVWQHRRWQFHCVISQVCGKEIQLD